MNIDTKDLEKLDFRETAIPIGVRLESKERDQLWLALSKDDWRALHVCLNKPWAIGESAAEMSLGLRRLAEIAAAAIKWYDRTGTVARPEGSGVDEE